MRPARSSIRAASCGLLLIRLTQSQSRWMRKKPVLAAAAAANVDDTQCILDLEKRRKVSTRPCTMGHGVRGHRRTAGVQARIPLAASGRDGSLARATGYARSF